MKHKKFDVISIGDSTHDTFVEIDEANILCDKDTKKCQICFSWADKIPAKKVTQVPGVGNSANAAVAFARLGFKTAISTNVGNDIVAESIKKVFEDERVSRVYVAESKNKPSNYSVVINYGAERTILVHHELWNYHLPAGMNAQWFYYSSLGPNHSRLHKQITDCVKRGIKLAFQPGTYQLREGKKKLKGILQSSEVILLNKEEAQQVSGEKSQNPKEIMQSLYRLGPKVVVMTDGPQGAYCFDGEQAYFAHAFPPKAKERTGAGDSFSSGFVGALMRGKKVSEALLWGNANSTSVVQYVGAQKGLLSEAGIKKMIKKYKRIRPERI